MKNDELNYELSSEETKIILPKLISLLKWRKGKENAVTNKRLVMLLTAMGHNISQPRIRKMINHIRTNNLVHNLLANSHGYYVTNDENELTSYINSLHKRANEINKIAEALQKNKKYVY